MKRHISVVLADDHPLVRSGIRNTLAVEERIRVVGEAANGADAQHLCEELQPDVLLLDLNMPGPRPVDTVTYLQKHCPSVKVLVLTAYDDDAYIRGLISVGVAGYVLKDEAPETVVQAIKTIIEGGTWFSRSVINKLALGNSGEDESMAESLSEKERQLLGMIGRGWDNYRIASELNLAEQTVRNYISRIYHKLNLTSRGEAVVWVRDHNLSGR